MAANDDAVAALAVRVAALERLVLDLCWTITRGRKAKSVDLTHSLLNSIIEAAPHLRPALAALVESARAERTLSEDVLAARQDEAIAALRGPARRE
jgi:hypothetical protein